MATTHAELMDRVFGLQTHFYDITRDRYLFGREEIMRRMDPQPEDRILEIGCGTGRNLRKLVKKYPVKKVYGIDVSPAMMRYARQAIAKDGLEDQIVLVEDYAEKMDPKEHFGLDEPFNKVFFSYSLSMIPTWKETLENTISHMTDDGVIYMTDFYDQAGWPAVVRVPWKWWLGKIHVKYEAKYHEYLRERAEKHGDEFFLEGYMGNYYYISGYRKIPKETQADETQDS